MRKTIRPVLIVVSLMFHCFALAQNVGIGNNAPQEKLHVTGGILSDSVKIGAGSPMLRTIISSPSALMVDVNSSGSFWGAAVAGWQSFTATSNTVLDYVSLGLLTPYTIGELRIYSGEGTLGIMLASVTMPSGISGYNNSPVLNVNLQAGQKYTIWVANKFSWTWQTGSYAGGRSDISPMIDKSFRVYTKDVTTVMNTMGNGTAQVLMEQPNSLFAVNGQVSTSTLLVGNGAGDGKVLISDANGNASWQTSVANNWGLDGNTVVSDPRIGTVSNHAVRVITNDNEVARFHADGGLSIGTPVSGEKLFVNGNIMTTPGQSIYLGGLTYLGGDGTRLNNNSGNSYFDHKGTGNIYFRADNVNGGSSRMIISGSTGNIGIGTVPEDAYKLVVQGDMKVSGGDIESAANLIVNNNVSIGGRIIQDPMFAPTLVNLWVHTGAPYATPGYYKGKDSRIYLQGTVSNGLIGTIFILPVGYRPAAQILFIVPSTDSDGQSVISIYPSGDVFCQSTGFVRVHLDGISFRVN